MHIRIVIPSFLLLFLTSFLRSVAQNNDIDNSVLIPGGDFQMGKDSERGSDFSPAHTVHIDSFYIDKYEVTNAKYKAFCEATGYRLPEFWNTDAFRCGDNYPDFPVVGINWYDAMRYAEWAGKRLPTEAKWEYTARGGLIDRDYPTGDTLGRIEEKKQPGTWINRIIEVGLFHPNGFGLHDMDGNVWEWVTDNYDEQYYINSSQDNPQGPMEGNNKVIRGGCWHSGPMCKRVYFRKGILPNWVDFAVGFRCAKDE